MEILIALLTLFLMGAFVVGMIKPSLVLKWDNKPSRLKIFAYTFIGFFIVGFLTTFIEVEKSETINNKENKIEIINKLINEKKYDEAKSIAVGINSNDSIYLTAQSLLSKIDSIKNEEDKIKRQKEEEQKEEEKKKKINDKIEQLKREIASIDKGIDFNNNDNSVEGLQMNIVLFGSWAILINENENSNNPQLKKLAKELKKKVKRLQVREFPRLRKKYAKIVANKLWEHDINVYTSGKGARIINFTGGIYAANRNIKETQNTLDEVLRMFRFRQSRYRWYKYADEYTYYTLFKGKDSDLVTYK